MSFVTDSAVESFVKDLLAKGTSETLAGFWTSIISSANSAAYQFIVQYWASKGYSASQVSNWDFGATFQKRLAGFLAVNRVYAMYPSDYAGALQGVMDPRKELLGDTQLGMEPQPLIIDGEFADPEGSRGSVSYGEFNTDADLFVVDEDDVRRGQVTRI